MRIYTKKLLSVLTVLAILLSSMNMVLSVFAAETGVNLQLNGGTLQGSSQDYSAGDTLPNYESITKAGAVFGGWYANADFSGTQIFTVPEDASAGTTYYARWIYHDISFDGFDSYEDDSAMKGYWDNWSDAGVADYSLNTESAHACDGKSMKIDIEKANTNAYFLVQNRDYSKTGEGVAFWIESENGVTVKFRFNGNAAYATEKILPAGRHILTVPWSELNGALSVSYLWKTEILVKTSNAGEAVYIDNVGNFSDYTESKVSFNLNGGSWADGYTPAETYGPAGLELPDTDNVKKTGLAFAGWYDNEALEGSAVYSIAVDTLGDKEYWAKWVVHDVSFDDFESYDYNADMLNDNHWSDWKWPTQKAETSLNTDAAHAHNGDKSMKVSLNEANKEDQLVVARQNYQKGGDGVAFWIESANGASVSIQFNGSKTMISAAKSIPAGKLLVTIPWSEIPGAESASLLWQTSLHITVPNASDTVYIDEIGTYSEDISSAYDIKYYTLGGNWTDGYTAPVKYSAVGAKLPVYGNIEKQGYIFAGWYDNKDYSGTPVTETPESGSIRLYAKWIKANAEYDNFEAYTDTTGYDPWSESAVPSLNTDTAYVFDGANSLKIDVAAKTTYKQNYATLCKQGTFNRAGDGISFWIKSETAVDLLFALNDQNKTYEVSVPSGRNMVTIPWDEFTAAGTADSWWCMFFRVKTLDSIARPVYIDSVGTYTAVKCDKVLSERENGFVYSYGENGVWSYSEAAGGDSYIGFATDFILEKGKKYVIAFDYKYLTDSELDMSLEPQAVGSAFDEAEIADKDRRTLNAEKANTDWETCKVVFGTEDENKYLGFAAKVKAGSEYDISIKNIRLYELGDVDFSGETDASDLSILKRELLGVKGAEFADVNDDGAVDIKDLIILKRMLAK